MSDEAKKRGVSVSDPKLAALAKITVILAGLEPAVRLRVLSWLAEEEGYDLCRAAPLPHGTATRVSLADRVVTLAREPLEGGDGA